MKWIFFKLDQFIFNRIDSFADSSFWQYIGEFISKVDQQYQRLVTLLMAILISFSPYLLLLLLMLCASPLWHRVDQLKTLQQLLKENVVLDGKMKDGKISFSNSALASPDALNSWLASLRDKTSLKEDELFLNNDQDFKFNIHRLSNGASQLSATVQFKNMSNDQLVDLFKELTQANFQIVESELQLSEDKFINGYLRLVQFLKD